MQRDQAHRTNELLERIAIALEKNNKKENGARVLVDEIGTNNINEIPGFEGTKDALDNLTITKDVLDTVKTITDDYASTKDEEVNDDVHNDYLNDLIQDMNHTEYLNYHHDMAFGFSSSDAAALTQHIYDLEYEECLGAIQRALLITGDEDYISYAGGDEEAGRNFVEELLENENTTQPENDPYTYDNNLTEYLDGVVNDSDHNLRKTAKFYEDEYLDKEGATKKECILDYVTNEFGSHGARYSEITKFCYYLGASNTPVKHNATRDRGYYACALTVGPWNTGYLVTGGTNQLVKGINKEGKERYFALSEVESFTDYWKYLDRD